MSKNQWLGLFKVKEGLYRSVPISKQSLDNFPDRFRLFVRYNTYYVAGGRKPRFVCAVLDSHTNKETVGDYIVPSTDIGKLPEEDPGVDLTGEMLKALVQEANSEFLKAATYAEKARIAELYRARIIKDVEMLTGISLEFSRSGL